MKLPQRVAEVSTIDPQRALEIESAAELPGEYALALPGRASHHDCPGSTRKGKLD
jgi:hypothetical protein